MVLDTFVLGSVCLVDKATARADDGDAAVVYAISSSLANNTAEVWIFEDEEDATAIGKHVVAVQDGRMADQLAAARVAELTGRVKRKLVGCHKRSFNVGFATAWRDMFEESGLGPDDDPMVGLQCNASGLVIVCAAGSIIAPLGAVATVISVRDDVCALEVEQDDVVYSLSMSRDAVRASPVRPPTVPSAVVLGHGSSFVFKALRELPGADTLPPGCLDCAHVVAACAADQRQRAPQRPQRHA